MLGIKAYFWARVPDLRVPITVLVDYRGFRIIGNYVFIAIFQI